MDTGALISKTVVYIDDEAVTHVDIDLGTRPFAVDANDRTLIAIWGGIDPGNVPIEVDILGRSEAEP
jgi:hypothetical protein